jgi:hypothetical protein
MAIAQKKNVQSLHRDCFTIHGENAIGRAVPSVAASSYPNCTALSDKPALKNCTHRSRDALAESTKPFMLSLLAKRARVA